MERESFENALIAGFMNAHFVNIKVDREERPDLDDIYMNAVTAITGNGGWPLSVFLTPDLKPFFGGTYFPPSSRYGMPLFWTCCSISYTSGITSRQGRFPPRNRSQPICRGFLRPLPPGRTHRRPLCARRRPANWTPPLTRNGADGAGRPSSPHRHPSPFCCATTSVRGIPACWPWR